MIVPHPHYHTTALQIYLLPHEYVFSKWSIITVWDLGELITERCLISIINCHRQDFGLLGNLLIDTNFIIIYIFIRYGKGSPTWSFIGWNKCRYYAESNDESQLIRNQYKRNLNSIAWCMLVLTKTKLHLATSLTSFHIPLAYVSPRLISMIIPTYTLRNFRFLTWVVKATYSCFLTPLTHVLNISLLNGVFISELKIDRVIPLFKSGEPSKYSNYRPVFVLPLFAKILERLMYTRLLSFITKHDILYALQFGFRKFHSQSLALIILADRKSKALENGDFILGSFL